MLIISSVLGAVIRFENVKELCDITDTLIAFRNSLKKDMRIAPFYDLVLSEDKLHGMAKKIAVQKFVHSTGGVQVHDDTIIDKKSRN